MVTPQKLPFIIQAFCAGFPPNENKTKTFPLDQADDYILFNHSSGFATFNITGIISASFRGGQVFDAYLYYVSKLRFGQPISAGHFTYDIFPFGIMAETGCCSSQWDDPV